MRTWLGPRAGLALLGQALIGGVFAGVPSEPLYFTEQLVDHFSSSTRTFSQRYYENKDSFAGPGSPIIVVLGGEGAIPPSTGIFYQWVVEEVAPRFGALVVEPEHRFYGETLPFGPGDSYSKSALELLTPQQALADAAHFIKHIQKKYACDSNENDLDGNQLKRCPIITLGGSYPGWMSAMMRLRYPSIVDMAYAASAPMTFYTQQVGQYDYYEVITRSAETASAGCAQAVSAVLGSTLTAEAKIDKDTFIKNLNLCQPLPDYLQEGDLALLQEEVAMVVMYTFANLNMANYPPPDTGLKLACDAFVSATAAGDSPWDILSNFLNNQARTRFQRGSGILLTSTESPHKRQEYARRLMKAQAYGSCFDMAAQLPAGDNATISAGDWSGVGTGTSGESWDYETCTFLVEAIGTNNKTDMFPPRSWNYRWLDNHCYERFGVQPQPTELVDLWGFTAESLVRQGVTRILFTNGMNDGWSAGGFKQDLSDSLRVINVARGAHHSDLSYVGEETENTRDVFEARATALDILASWLKEVQQA